MSSSQTGILTGARLAVEALEQAGVQVVFGLPGVHNLALWRALGESPVRLVGVRHEQTAGYAADGYARASGRVGVALTTTGPGAANTLGALGEAWASRQPVVVIATDIPTRLRRPGVWRGVLHEATDQAAMFEPVTKETVRVGSAAEIGAAISRALASAAAAPQRPVYVEIPTDLLDAQVTDPPESTKLASSAPRAAEEQLTRAAQIADASRRPLIWAGGGALQSGAGRRSLSSPKGSWLPCCSPTLPPACFHAGIPAWSRRRRTCPKRARFGTRPTSCSASARISTG